MVYTLSRKLSSFLHNFLEDPIWLSEYMHQICSHTSCLQRLNMLFGNKTLHLHMCRLKGHSCRQHTIRHAKMLSRLYVHWFALLFACATLIKLDFWIHQVVRPDKHVFQPVEAAHLGRLMERHAPKLIRIENILKYLFPKFERDLVRWDLYHVRNGLGAVPETGQNLSKNDQNCILLSFFPGHSWNESQGRPNMSEINRYTLYKSKCSDPQLTTTRASLSLPTEQPVPCDQGQHASSEWWCLPEPQWPAVNPSRCKHCGLFQKYDKQTEW